MLILISTAESPSDAVVERWGACSQAGWWEAKSQLAANANGAGIWSVYTLIHTVYTQTDRLCGFLASDRS